MSVTHRESIGSALARALAKDPDAILFGEDIADPYGGAFKVTKGLSEDFPGRVVNTPISEASITGLATGAALRGLHPVLEIMFADFLTLCADQIVNHASKFRSMFGDVDGLPMVIRAPTGGYRGYGPTHSQSMERMFFGFPDMTIVAPSDFHDSGRLLEQALDSRQLTLFMEHKLLYERTVLGNATESRYQGFRLSRTQGAGLDETVVLTPCDPGETPMITVVTYGGVSAMVFAAAREVFLEEEITCEIVVPAVIKQPRLDAIVASAKQSGRVLVVEEGHLSWGWGAEVAAQVMQHCFASLRSPVVRLAAKDEPIPCARPLEDAVLPQQRDVVLELMKLAEAADRRHG